MVFHTGIIWLSLLHLLFILNSISDEYYLIIRPCGQLFIVYMQYSIGVNIILLAILETTGLWTPIYVIIFPRLSVDKFQIVLFIFIVFFKKKIKILFGFVYCLGLHPSGDPLLYHFALFEYLLCFIIV